MAFFSDCVNETDDSVVGAMDGFGRGVVDASHPMRKPENATVASRLAILNDTVFLTGRTATINE